MRYSYLLVYALSRGNFSFFGGNGNNMEIYNAFINSKKPIKEWMKNDFENLKEKIADNLTQQIEKDGRISNIIQYRANQISILNIIEKSFEEMEDE